jgi:adenylate cyclase
MLGITLSFLGELTASRTYLEQGLALYDAKRHLSLTFQYGADQRSAGLAWLAKDLWLLGYPDQAVQARDEAIARAHEAAHAITLAHGLSVGGLYVDAMLRDWRSAQEHAAALKVFAERQRLSYWRTWAKFFLGRTLAERESTTAAVAQMRETLSEFGLANYRVDRPFFLVMLAEAHGRLGQTEAGLYLIDEALASVEQTEARWWEAEVHRLRGNLLALERATGPATAEGCFERAMAIARRQRAKSLELRAATSLARLLAGRGERQQSLELLAPIYGWFTEGFGTPDLVDAKSVLDTLS